MSECVLIVMCIGMMLLLCALVFLVAVVDTILPGQIFLNFFRQPTDNLARLLQSQKIMRGYSGPYSKLSAWNVEPTVPLDTNDTQCNWAPPSHH